MTFVLEEVSDGDKAIRGPEPPLRDCRLAESMIIGPLLMSNSSMGTATFDGGALV